MQNEASKYSNIIVLPPTRPSLLRRYVFLFRTSRIRGYVSLLSKRNTKAEDTLCPYILTLTHKSTFIILRRTEEAHVYVVFLAFSLYNLMKMRNLGAGCTNVGKWIRVSKKKILERKYALANKMKRIKIHGFGRFRRKWLKLPKFSPVTRYMKLE